MRVEDKLAVAVGVTAGLSSCGLVVANEPPTIPKFTEDGIRATVEAKLKKEGGRSLDYSKIQADKAMGKINRIAVALDIPQEQVCEKQSLGGYPVVIDSCQAIARYRQQGVRYNTEVEAIKSSDAYQAYMARLNNGEIVSPAVVLPAVVGLIALSVASFFKAHRSISRQSRQSRELSLLTRRIEEAELAS